MSHKWLKTPGFKSVLHQISPQLMQNLTEDRSQTQTHTCAIHEGTGGLTPDQHIYHDHSPAPSLLCFRAKHLTQNALGRLAVSAITAQTKAHPCDGKHTCMASTLQKHHGGATLRQKAFVWSFPFTDRSPDTSLKPSAMTECNFRMWTWQLNCSHFHKWSSETMSLLSGALFRVSSRRMSHALLKSSYNVTDKIYCASIIDGLRRRLQHISLP